MTTRWNRALALVLATLSLMATQALAQEGMPQFGAPEQMKALAKYDGTYDVEFSIQPAPEAGWMTSAATCEFKTVVDGSAQQMLYDGTMMGMPFRGIGLTAYNRSTGKWQTTWVDNMMAQISFYEGDWTENKLIVTGIDHMEGNEVLSRLTTTFVSDDKMDWLFETSSDGGKTYTAGAKATYTRQK